MHRKENAILEISLSSSASPRFQVVQDVQGQEIHLYADGSLPGWRALDNPQGQRWVQDEDDDDVHIEDGDEHDGAHVEDDDDVHDEHGGAHVEEDDDVYDEDDDEQ